MYKRQYGLIRTLAPLHVGASAGEESGNLNLIFRDPYTQTGIIPGSSIRGRFRAECRSSMATATAQANSSPSSCDIWYGSPSGAGKDDIKEGNVKFEHASLVWLPVFCPGQPIVWVSSPRLLRRYAAIVDPSRCGNEPRPYSASNGLPKTLFFNLGFIKIKFFLDLSGWLPKLPNSDIPSDRFLVVDDADMGLIHDMALYRQSRVRLEDREKKASDGGFFNVEALPEGSILVFPIALKPSIGQAWEPLQQEEPYGSELYFGGLESVGFGRCQVTLHSHQEANQ